MKKKLRIAAVLLAAAAVVATLSGCSVGSRIAKGAIDKAVGEAQKALATIEASLPTDSPQESAAPAESTAPEGEDSSTKESAAPAENATGVAGGWDADIPADVPKFDKGLYQSQDSAKYTTAEGTVISASFLSTTKDDAKAYVETLKDHKFDMSTMDVGDDLTAVGTLKLDKETISIVCGYKNDDKSFGIVVTIAKN